MRKTLYSPLLAGTAAAVLLASVGPWAVPGPAVAQVQVANCPLQAQVAVAGQTTANQAQIQAAQLTPQQKQSLCLAADQLERLNMSLTIDLTSALFPGTIGP